MTRYLSRRKFLKLGASALSLAALPPISWLSQDDPSRLVGDHPSRFSLPLPPEDLAARREGRWGRVTNWRAWVHSEPDPDAPRVDERRRDAIVTILDEVQGVGHYDHNPTWYQIVGGYIYSSWVQPVEYLFNQPITELDEAGRLAWVTVPYTEVRRQPDPELRRSYRLYYDAIFRVVELHVDPETGQVWYGLRDGLTWSGVNWAQAEHLRIVPPKELTPLSPEVQDKRILIELENQWLTCLEGEDTVFQTRVASGMWGMVTPQGVHKVLKKAHTTRMTGGTGSNYYDLPGIGFVTYFTAKGVAIHGTYWHNDYGRRRSHGCVNVSTAASQWIYRWTRPDVPYDQRRIVANAQEATLIEVVY